MSEHPNLSDHVVALDLDGLVTEDSIRRYKEALDRALARHDRVGIYCNLVDLSDISEDALVSGAKADLELLAHMDRLERVAVVSDKEWPVAVIRFTAPLMPTVEIKSFGPDESAAAAEWVSQIPAAQPVRAPAIRLIPTSDDTVLAFEIDGVITARELPALIDRVNAFLERNEKVRMLARVKHLAGVDPAVFTQGGLVSMKLAAMQKMDRYAIVGASGWLGRAIATLQPAFPGIDIQAYDADREDEAWAWLGATPSE